MSHMWSFFTYLKKRYKNGQFYSKKTFKMLFKSSKMSILFKEDKICWKVDGFGAIWIFFNQFSNESAGFRMRQLKSDII